MRWSNSASVARSCCASMTWSSTRSRRTCASATGRNSSANLGHRSSGTPYAQAYGVPEERWPKFAEEFRPVAEAQVRRDLVLDHVMDAQQLRATEAELDQRIQELAERRGMAPGQLYASLEKAKRLRDVERSITEEKVFAFLLSQSTVEQPRA